MDWPDADGDGGHVDKRLVDDYYSEGSRKGLAEKYGWAAVYWLTRVVWVYGVRKGGGR